MSAKPTRASAQPSRADLWRLVQDLAEVYTVDTDQITMLRLVQRARAICPPRYRDVDDAVSRGLSS